MSFEQCPDCGYQEGDPFVIHTRRTPKKTLRDALEKIQKMSPEGKLSVAQMEVSQLHEKKFCETSPIDHIQNALGNLELYRARVFNGTGIGEEPNAALDQLRADLLCALQILKG